MLQTIRDRASGLIAWIIVILIVIPFVLWGINDYFDGSTKPYAAKVNDTDISVQEFQQAYQQQRQRLQDMLGGALNSSLVNETAMKREVLQQLVENELLLQAAVGAGLRIGNQQLAAEIQSIEAFQKDGVFSGEQYRAQLRRAGAVPADFEAQQRRSMLMQQFYTGIANTAVVSAQDLDRMLRIQDQQREIGYLVLPVSAFIKDVNVSDQDVAQYYEANKGRLTHPEQVRIDYVELSAEAIANRIQPEEQDLRKLYDEQSGAFTTEEQRRASHILVQVPEGADEKIGAAAREKAEKLLQRVRSGESFENLAKELSDDTVSAKEGGDLGFFGKGVMVPEFEQAAFAMQKGEVSDLVKSPFGFHIIKLTDIKPGGKKSFEEARPELIKQLRDNKAEEEYYALVDRLTNLAYENPDSLEPAAQTLGLEIKESGWLTRAGDKEGITSNPQVVSSAFGEEVLSRGLNSELIEIGPKHVIVLRVKEHKPATPRTLEEVRPDIAAELRTRAAKEKVRELGEEMRAHAAEGANLEQLAAEHNVKVTRTGLVGRGEKNVAPAILQAAFKLQRPADGKSSYGTVALESGDYAVVAVTAVQDGDPAKVTEERRKSLIRMLAQMNGASEFAALINQLKSQAKIVVNEDRL